MFLRKVMMRLIYLSVLTEYRCSYVKKIRNLKKLSKDNFIFSSVK